MSARVYRHAELRDNIHQLTNDELNELFAYEEAQAYDDDHEEQEWHVMQTQPSLKQLLEQITHL